MICFILVLSSSLLLSFTSAHQQSSYVSPVPVIVTVLPVTVATALFPTFIFIPVGTGGSGASPIE